MVSIKKGSLSRDPTDFDTYPVSRKLLSKINKPVPYFSSELDNEDEDELTDDDCRERVKNFKVREMRKRADASLELAAVSDIAQGIQNAASNVKQASAMTLDLKELRHRQSRIRSLIDAGDEILTSTFKTPREESVHRVNVFDGLP